MLMVKTICRDYGRNTGMSERNVKSGKRPKSKSPSESPAARPTPSANDLTPSRRTATAAADEDVPSATRHLTPDDLGDDLDDVLDGDLDDDSHEARP